VTISEYVFVSHDCFGSACWFQMQSKSKCIVLQHDLKDADFDELEKLDMDYYNEHTLHT